MPKGKGNAISRALRIASQGRGLLVASCAASVAGQLAALVPYLSVYFIMRALLLEADADHSAEIAFWAAVAGAGIAVNMVLAFLGNLGCHVVAFRLLYGLRMRVLEHLGRLPLGFFATTTTGSIQKTMDESIEKVEGFVAHMLPDVIGAAVVVVVLFGGIALMSPPLALVALLAVALAYACQLLIFSGKQLQSVSMETALAAQRMTGAFGEFVKGIAEVKLFGRAGSTTQALEGAIFEYRDWELTRYRTSSLPMAGYKAILISLIAFVLPVGIVTMQVAPGPDAFMSVLMVLILVPAIYDPLLTCVSYGTQLAILGPQLDSIDAILDSEALAAPADPKEPSSWDVELDHVSFTYQDDADPSRRFALDDVSIAAPQGKVCALVGPSGAGKSTVGQLISRFWDPGSGRVLIGGVDVRDIDPAFLMDHVATVFQDTYLFSDTVRGNISMGRDVTDDEVEAAARAAQCHDFIMALPQGYETRIGSGGARLSGGEAQRLSIARAILKGSPIVVLDEALAYSDAENENLIHEAIRNLLADKTVIIIAHRLQSVCDADRIVVLRDGRVVERGTHEELMDAHGEYRELWDLQHEAEAWDVMAHAFGEEGGAR